MKKFITGAVLAFSLTAAPIATAYAAPLRASAPTTEASSLFGRDEGGGLILALIIAAGVLAAILSQNNSDLPDSP